MRILLVEDNELLGEGLVTALKQEGYAVDWLRSGTSASNVPFTESFDLVILDLGLPGVDGMTLLRDWRSRKLLTPVLILTARDSLESRVSGLDSGADDFMTKPFERAELMARLRSLLRRSRQSDQNDCQLHYGDIVLDTSSHSVLYKSHPVTISNMEFSLLHSLIERPGKVFTRDQLQQSLYSWDETTASNTLEVYIHNLRKKFYPELIKTVRGVGYVCSQQDSNHFPDNSV